MAITATQVKELRERTGAGMMECKKALVECDGDLDKAIDHLRKAGAAKADKKAGRTAAEGRIIIHSNDNATQAAMVEINCETDFVANDDNFVEFAGSVAQCVLSGNPGNLDALSALPLKEGNSRTVEEARKELITKIGENINIRRFERMQSDNGRFGIYMHMNNKIGVVVQIDGGDDVLAKDIAMHIAASRPICITAEDVPADLVKKEKEIFRAQAEKSGKPADIVEKMITGRLNKYFKEITLLGQSFVKDADLTVEKLLKDAGARVIRFERMEVGEGIEKRSENFADEVMAQVQGT